MIEIQTPNLSIENLVDSVADYIKSQNCLELDLQKVCFVTESNKVWNNWYVSESKRNVVNAPFLVALMNGLANVTPKGVDYTSMSERDAIFKINDKIYYMSV